MWRVIALTELTVIRAGIALRGIIRGCLFWEPIVVGGRIYIQGDSNGLFPMMDGSNCLGNLRLGNPFWIELLKYVHFVGKFENVFKPYL